MEHCEFSKRWEEAAAVADHADHTVESDLDDAKPAVRIGDAGRLARDRVAVVIMRPFDVGGDRAGRYLPIIAGPVGATGFEAHLHAVLKVDPGAFDDGQHIGASDRGLVIPASQQRELRSILSERIGRYARQH